VQTLAPGDTPHRQLLVFIAFAAATRSARVQGRTVKTPAGRLFQRRRPQPTSAAELRAIRSLQW